MAVPASGTLTMLGIAQERKFGTYGTGTISSPILMTDLINSGGSNSFPALNTSGTSVPNTSAPHAMSEWYGYDQDYVSWRSFTIENAGYGDGEEACSLGGSDDTTLYYASGGTGTGAACPSAGVTVYTDTGLSSAFDGVGQWFKSTLCNAAHLIDPEGYLEDVSAC